MKNSRLIGLLTVAFGACSYGVLATIVKLSYQNGFSLQEVTFAQYSVGWLLLFIIFLCRKKQIISIRQVVRLIGFGCSLGLTGLLYYQSVKYVPVSFGIVLLMQSTWLGIILDYFVFGRALSLVKILGAILVILGAFLCSNIHSNPENIHLSGIMWGLLAAVSYTITIYASAHIAKNIDSLQRSFYLSTGGFLCVVFFVVFGSFGHPFNWDIFSFWGLLLALFGTILPPVLFAYGMPKVGVSTGTILGALELPVSVGCAYLFLNEELNLLNVIGLFLILGAVVLVNIKAQPEGN